MASIEQKKTTLINSILRDGVTVQAPGTHNEFKANPALIELHDLLAASGCAAQDAGIAMMAEIS